MSEKFTVKEHKEALLELLDLQENVFKNQRLQHLGEELIEMNKQQFIDRMVASTKVIANTTMKMMEAVNDNHEFIMRAEHTQPWDKVTQEEIERFMFTQFMILASRMSLIFANDRKFTKKEQEANKLLALDFDESMERIKKNKTKRKKKARKKPGRKKKT